MLFEKNIGQCSIPSTSCDVSVVSPLVYHSSFPSFAILILASSTRILKVIFIHSLPGALQEVACPSDLVWMLEGMPLTKWSTSWCPFAFFLDYVLLLCCWDRLSSLPVFLRSCLFLFPYSILHALPPACLSDFITFCFGSPSFSTSLLRFGRSSIRSACLLRLFFFWWSDSSSWSSCLPIKLPWSSHFVIFTHKPGTQRFCTYPTSCVSLMRVLSLVPPVSHGLFSSVRYESLTSSYFPWIRYFQGSCHFAMCVAAGWQTELSVAQFVIELLRLLRFRPYLTFFTHVVRNSAN